MNVPDIIKILIIVAGVIVLWATVTEPDEDE